MVVVRSVVPTTMPLTMTTMLLMVQTSMPAMVPMMDGSAVNRTMSLGDPLRGRAFRSNRAARFPLQSLSPPRASRAAHSACPAARCAPRRCRDATVVVTIDGIGRLTAVCSSRRRCAPRSSQCSPRSPWPAAPAAGIASARRGSTPCVAGAGFAAHRAPHYAVQSCPHRCGHFRPSLRQRASHDCLRLRPHRRPLTRRGGSPPPGSPASIPQTSMLPIRPSRPPGRPWVSHRNAAGCRARHRVTESALPVPIDDMRRQEAPGATRSGRVLRRTRVLSHSCHRVAPPVPRKHRPVAPGLRGV